MKTTLKDIQKTNEHGEKTLLGLKRYLREVKKEGIVFYKEDIFLLKDDEEFELYFYEMPSSKTEKNAFPIPINDYFQKIKKGQMHLLNDYYFDYYKETTNKDFSNHQFYLSEGLVWCYQF